MRYSLCLIMKCSFLIFFLSISLQTVLCDLPVHCKREQIEGEWIFRINTDLFNPDLNEYKTSCGHGFPDRIEKTVGDINYSFQNYNDIKLILKANYKIYENDSPVPVGNWTPVYDEGFIVYYRNSIFTAFMKYYLKEKSNSPKPNNSLYNSNCDKTMIGWYIRDKAENNKNWSCFFGFKTNIRNEFLSQKNFLKPNEKFNHFDYIRSDNDEKNYFNGENSSKLGDEPELESFLELKMKHQSKSKMKLWMSRYEEQNEIVNEINRSNLLWKAQVNDEFKGLSFIQLKEKMGMKKNKMHSVDYYNFNVNNKKENFFGNNNYGFDSIENEINEDFKVNNFSFNQTPSTSINNDRDNVLESLDLDINNFNNSNNNSLNNSSRSVKGNNDNFFIQNGKTNFEKNESKKAKRQESNNNYNMNSSNEFSDQKAKGNLSTGRDRDGHLETDYSVISKYINNDLNEIDENSLPKNWDWRNIGGINYVPDPRKQGDCGSCYIFSIVSSLESRLRILTNNKDKTEFSRQFPVSCSFYTEGCDGGYPILVAKFFNEFEIVPESCFEYRGKNDQCSNVCDYKQNPLKYYVSRYEYLGGFYGATNEVEIMKELRARGPIPGNMTVPWSFSYYKSGIYSENSLKKNSGNLNKTTLLDKNLSWSSVDHSILLVGYGEQNGVKYWIGMNTWGKNWGENGFFRILRGENDCNIETMGDAARIAFKNR